MSPTILYQYFLHLTLRYPIFQLLHMKLKINLLFEPIFFMFNKHQNFSFNNPLIFRWEINEIIHIIILIILIAFKDIWHNATNIFELILGIIINIAWHLHLPNFNLRSLVISNRSKANGINRGAKCGRRRIYFFDIDFSLINTRERFIKWIYLDLKMRIISKMTKMNEYFLLLLLVWKLGFFND